MWLIKRYPVYTYSAILGLVVASPVAVLLRCDMTGVNVLIVLISLVTFAAGYIGASFLVKDGRTKGTCSAESLIGSRVRFS